MKTRRNRVGGMQEESDPELMEAMRQSTQVPEPNSESDPELMEAMRQSTQVPEHASESDPELMEAIRQSNQPDSGAGLMLSKPDSDPEEPEPEPEPTSEPDSADSDINESMTPATQRYKLNKNGRRATRRRNKRQRKDIAQSAIAAAAEAKGAERAAHDNYLRAEAAATRAQDAAEQAQKHVVDVSQRPRGDGVRGEQDADYAISEATDNSKTIAKYAGMATEAAAAAKQTLALIEAQADAAEQHAEDAIRESKRTDPMAFRS